MKSLNTTSFILAAFLITTASIAGASTGSFKTSSLEDEAYERARMLTEEDTAAKDVVRSYKRIGAEKVCSQFATETALGAYGRVVDGAFRKSYFPTLEKGTADLKAVCKNYDNLPLQEKAELWTVVIGSMAFYESTCNPSAQARGPHGTAMGILQLFYGNEAQFDGGEFCKRQDAANAKRSILCGLSMLDNYLAKSGSLFPQKGDGKIYWEVLLVDAKKKMSIPKDIHEREPTIGKKANGATMIKLAIDEYCK